MINMGIMMNTYYDDILDDFMVDMVRYEIKENGMKVTEVNITEDGSLEAMFKDVNGWIPEKIFDKEIRDVVELYWKISKTEGFELLKNL